MKTYSIPTELLTLGAVEIEVCDWSPTYGEGYYFRFANGWTASVQRHFGTYGYESGLWEVAHKTPAGEWDWDTLGTGDVLGFLTMDEVVAACREISSL